MKESKRAQNSCIHTGLLWTKVCGHWTTTLMCFFPSCCHKGGSTQCNGRFLYSTALQLLFNQTKRNTLFQHEMVMCTKLAPWRHGFLRLEWKNLIGLKRSLTSTPLNTIGISCNCNYSLCVLAWSHYFFCCWMDRLLQGAKVIIKVKEDYMWHGIEPFGHVVYVLVLVMGWSNTVQYTYKNSRKDLF